MATSTMILLLLCIQIFTCLRFSFGFETIEDYICTQRFRGCRVDYGRRSCLQGEVVGCWNPFPYGDMDECLDDFYGNSNICEKHKPCHNNGICSQVTNERSGRTFKCECANTGHFGQNCEKKCPKVLSSTDPSIIPCLEI